MVHLAAVNEIVCIENPGLALQVNGLGSKNVAEAAVAAGVQRLIYVSTFHVYGSCDGTITEETVPIPSHPYGISKLVGELFCRKEGLATIILRCANGVGVPHDPDEIERIDPFTDKIPYTWDLRHE